MSIVPDKATVARVMRAVAEHYGLDPASLKEKGRERARCHARRVALLCLRQLFPLASNMTFGQTFGRDDHTWCGYQLRQITDLAYTEPDTWSEIEKVVSSVVDAEKHRREVSNAEA